jgi:hypothetical protein
MAPSPQTLYHPQQCIDCVATLAITAGAATSCESIRMFDDSGLCSVARHCKKGALSHSNGCLYVWCWSVQRSGVACEIWEIWEHRGSTVLSIVSGAEGSGVFREDGQWVVSGSLSFALPFCHLAGSRS